ncbi:MAG: glycosyl transferase family 2 [Herbinix sp.]|jgi:glycosyltransferase involved in cell wall biosynthesis|nr:glycosyl transferase family 2 [Herbinix sp.]
MDAIHFCIIMPVYNSQNYLSGAIESVLNQTYKNFTLILIDDGSTDQSKELCDQYSLMDPRIRLILKKNEGISKTRNLGIDLAEGHYIYFMDHDDRFHPMALKILHTYLSEEAPDILMFGVKLINMKNGIKTCQTERKLPDFYLTTKSEINSAYAMLLEKGMLFCVWDKVYRSDFIKENHSYFNPVFTNGGEDLDFNLQLYPYLTRLMNIGDVLYEYYLRDTQSTYRKFNPRIYEQSIRNLQSIVATANKVEVDVTEYGYLRYIEYKLRLLFMLGHRDCAYSLREKVYLCRKKFRGDGFTNNYKKKAYQHYLRTPRNSLKKKLLVSAVYFKCYYLALMLIKYYSISR